jgi:hypothetical protein
MMVGDWMDTDVVAGIEAGLDTILSSPARRPSRTSRSIRTGREGFLHPSPRRSTSSKKRGPTTPAREVNIALDRLRRNDVQYPRSVLDIMPV